MRPHSCFRQETRYYISSLPPDAAQNFSTLRRIALNLLKTETVKSKEPIRGKRIFAALDPAYLESIVGLRQM